MNDPLLLGSRRIVLLFALTFQGDKYLSHKVFEIIKDVLNKFVLISVKTCSTDMYLKF